MSVKESLLEVIELEAARLARKAQEGLLLDEDVARIPALARAAEIVQGLRSTDKLDDRSAEELEKSLGNTQ